MDEINEFFSENYRCVELNSPPTVQYLQIQLEHGWQLAAICQSEWPQGVIHYYVYFRRVF